MKHIALPARIETLEDARALERASRRVETPCGAGRMVWRVWGEGAPIVLLHGGSGNWSHWARNIGPLVAAGRAVYAADLPGCGESDAPPEGHDGDALPQWIDKGLGVLLEGAPYDLVGFSFGGMVAGFFAATCPPGLRKLVLVAAPALTSAPGPKPGLREWLRLPDGPAREAAFRHNLRALMVARDETVDGLALGLYVEGLRADRLTKRRLARTDILLRTMPRISAPVWGIWGEDDVLTAGRLDLVEAGLRHAPDFRGMTRIPRAGHWVQFEEAGAVNAALADILGR